MTGLAVPVAAERFPVQRMVFLASMVPVIGKDANEGSPKGAATPRFIGFMEHDLVEHDDESTEWPTPEVAADALFDELPRKVAIEEARTLRRQYYTMWDEVSPLQSWPDCPTSYIVCADDRAVGADWQRDRARDTLGVEPVEIAGGHYPFLARPAELTDLLVSLDGS
jgi:pimeloyl-ACP methyl ester carboxylesterase